MIDWTTVVVSLVSCLFSAGALYGAIRVDVKYQRRDIDRAHQRIDNHEEKYIHKRA